jgi:putative transposase
LRRTIALSTQDARKFEERRQGLQLLRRFRVTPDSAHAMPVARNLLKQDFEVDEPKRVWVDDITYV